MIKYGIDVKNKLFVCGGVKYPLLYGLICPFTKKPVMVIIKTKEKAKNILPERRYVAQRQVDETLGIVFVRSDDQEYEKIGRKEYTISYFYGLKQDPLMGMVYESQGEDKGKKKFKESLLSGSLGNYKLSKELVKGEDILVAFKKEC